MIHNEHKMAKSFLQLCFEIKSKFQILMISVNFYLKSLYFCKYKLIFIDFSCIKLGITLI